MSELMTFFRGCPNSCGRSEIHLQDKKLVGDKIATTSYERPEGVASGFMKAVFPGGFLGAPHVLEETVPLSIDEQDSDYYLSPALIGITLR